MTQSIKLRPKARQDLRKIYKDGVKGWGVLRAEHYIKNLDRIFLKLANHQLPLKSAGNIKEGLLSYPAVSHMIFFRKTATGIEITRILHKRMDYKRHL